ncbi:hypothetical protein [Chryseobacterium sp. Leaf394]|uniref:hypothetical protein n=1 Tax=Chryseobacterium sp. Leaf394 TaxID=1736361 RepID=UPI0006F61EAD|nr:hypothetical protein [Chryseobacterium sp. Leaf394]KQS92971.1 hypothetical protein ASG21_11195 [Chryseobacterium sp. Leaf394]
MKKILFILSILISSLSLAQMITSNLQKKMLALGETNQLTIRIKYLNGEKVNSARENELLPFHFEEIKDSIGSADDYYERKIEFAVFEEGKFTIPELDFKVGNEILKTPAYEIEVVNTATKEDVINDIMSNKEVDLEMADYWELYKFYILAALAVIALIIAVIIILKYGRRVKKTSPKITTNLTLKELEVLIKKKYIESGDFRSFYVELIDISRRFITTQYQLPAEVLLTDDLIDAMKANNTISPDNEKILEEVFVRGDLVKFAKTFPDENTMQKDFSDIKTVVERSVKDIEFENLRKDV